MAASPPPTPTIDGDLRAFVASHRVAADVSPHFEMQADARVQTAIDITLYAARPQRGGADPGGAECRRVWQRLNELAERVVPPGARYSIDPFDASFRLRRETQWEPEINLVLEVFPADRGPGLETVDDAAKRVASAVIDGLDRLGVGHGVWREARRGGTGRPPGDET